VLGSIPNHTLKLILIDYEYSLNSQNNTEIKLMSLMKNKRLSIEHIAPQNILPGVKPIENINLIGNLVLTYNNSEMNNRTFLSKKNDFGNSTLASERELIEYNDWNDKTIIERGKKLRKFITDNWKV
jgi:hypothetical protein